MSSSSSCHCQISVEGARISTGLLSSIEHKRRRRHRQRFTQPDVIRDQVTRTAVQAEVLDTSLDKALLPWAQDLASLIDRAIGEDRLGRNCALPSLTRFLDGAILAALGHCAHVLNHSIRKINALLPEVVEFIAHPLRCRRIVVGPEDFIGVAQRRGTVIEAADK